MPPGNCPDPAVVRGDACEDVAPGLHQRLEDRHEVRGDRQPDPPADQGLARRSHGGHPCGRSAPAEPSARSRARRPAGRSPCPPVRGLRFVPPTRRQSRPGRSAPPPQPSPELPVEAPELERFGFMQFQNEPDTLQISATQARARARPAASASGPWAAAWVGWSRCHPGRIASAASAKACVQSATTLRFASKWNWVP